MDLKRYAGYFLDTVTVSTASSGSDMRITLVSSGRADTVVLTVAELLHVEMDTSGCWNDFIDEILVLQLPRYGAWPDEARHLLEHHNNQRDMVLLYLVGPGPFEILGARLIIDDNGIVV